MNQGDKTQAGVSDGSQQHSPAVLQKRPQKVAVKKSKDSNKKNAAEKNKEK